jgi:hypothetical protein
MPSLPSIANINPYSNAAIFKKEVSFSTQDEITGQSITEGYTVNGPFHTSITAIPLAGGTKFVVPLTSDTGSGAPFLKFHFPNGTDSNKMYVTFAVKNSRMADGYYDYTTGIPATYRTKLKSFIITGQNGQPIYTPLQLQNLSGPRSKEIRFTTYGSSTNKPAEAVTFYVTIKAIFTPNAIVSQPATGPVVLTPSSGGGTTTTTPSTGIPISGFPGVVAPPTNQNFQTR